MNAAYPIPGDPQLPQLARAIDAAAMRPVFDASLRRYGSQRVTGCRVDRIKYRPGRNCTVSYRLDIRDERRDCHYEQRVAGRFCAPGKAAARHARNRSRVTLPARCGVPALLVPGIEFFAWFLPNDPKLAGLPALCEVLDGRGAALAEAVEVMLGDATAVSEVQAGLIQYVPESRACARFDVRLGNGHGGRLFAKLERDQGGAATHRVMQALYDSPASREGRLRTPRSLLWQATSGLHWQQAVAGEVLLHRHAVAPPPVAAAVGRMMAALHATPVALQRYVGGDQLSGRLREMRDMLVRIQPAWRELLDALVARLAQRLPEVRALPKATLHGDLHPRNILIDDQRLTLIDLDGARSGPVVLELGVWIADSLARARLAGLDLAGAQQSAAALLDGYREMQAPAASSGLLAWATALALLERAFRDVASLRLGRLSHTPALLALASMIADGGDLERPLPSM